MSKVDKPKQGVGNTNDGNCARIFFKNPSIVSNATEIDEQLLIYAGEKLALISSTKNIDNFEKLCSNFGQRFRNLYLEAQISLSVRDTPEIRRLVG